MKSRLAMSTGARTRLKWVLALTTGVLANGCGSEENVSVGSVNRVLDLGVCLREGAACDVPPASVDVPEPLAPGDGAASQDPRFCDAEVSGMLAVDFQVDIADLICSGTRCNYNIKDFKVGADGSVWLLAHLFEPLRSTAQRAWLGHIAADGQVLGHQGWPLTRNGELAWTIALREDEAILLLTDGTNQSWTQHYDAGVNLTGSAFSFESIVGYRIAGTPEGGLVVSGLSPNSGVGVARSAVAMVDQSGNVTWSQGNVTGSIQAIEADGSGRAALISAPVSYMTTSSGIEYYGAHVTGFDASGNQAWSHVFDGFGWKLDSTGHKLEFDDQGNLTIALVKAPGTAWVQRFALNGDPSWAWSLESNLNLGMTVIPSDGRTFVVMLEGDTKLDGAGSLTELSADGQACRRYAYTGVSPIDRLVASSSGQIYFVGHQSVGRFEPI